MKKLIPESNRNALRQLYACVALLGVLTGCVKAKESEGTGSDYEKTRVGASASNEAKVLSEADGEIVAAITDNSRTTTLRGSDLGGASGSSVSFPPGSLSIGEEIKVGEGAPIASDLSSTDLGLQNNGIKPRGKALSVSSSSGGSLVSPMSLSLPLATSLMLNGSRSELLVVLFKVILEDKSVKIGLLPRGELLLSGNTVTFSSKHFGVFQIAYTTQLVSVKKEAPSTTPILTAKEQRALPEILWKAQTPVTAPGGKIAFAAAIIGISGVNKCGLIVDENKTEPWDSYSEIDVQGTTLTVPTKEFTRTNQAAHTVHGQFKCRAADGRESTSPWMSHDFPDNSSVSSSAVLLPPVIAGTPSVATRRPTWSWTSGGTSGSGVFEV